MHRAGRPITFSANGHARFPSTILRGSSDSSFGLFQDPESSENRDFLVYPGLLGLRGSSGTARKQPESTKLGPRKSESLVVGVRLEPIRSRPALRPGRAGRV